MTVTKEQLASYLDDALDERETARIEQALRGSEDLRQQLLAMMKDSDRGEHSLGAIWRRRRLSCPTREQLGSYVLKVLDTDHHEYVTFHLETIGCSFCQANLADLRSQQKTPQAEARRKRIFESSAGMLKK